MAGFKTGNYYPDSLLAPEHQLRRFIVKLKQTCFGHPPAVYWVGRRDLYILLLLHVPQCLLRGKDWKTLGFLKGHKLCLRSKLACIGGRTGNGPHHSDLCFATCQDVSPESWWALSVTMEVSTWTSLCDPGSFMAPLGVDSCSHPWVHTWGLGES